MANKKRLIPCGVKCTLDELPCGTLFAFGDDCIAVKSEYRCNNGLIEAFIIDSGEQFWGGVHTAKEQNELMVQPLEVMDAVEVVRCKDCKHGIWDEEEQMWECVLPVDLTGDLDTYSMFHEYNGGEHFCSYGERKDND